MGIRDLIEQATAYFAANRNMSGLLVAALGALLFVGALLKWEWVLSANRRFSLLRSIFGARGQMFIYSVVLILAGVAIFILL